MWSDPIDEALQQFENLLGKYELDERLTQETADLAILKRLCVDAKAHRELENRTGKVGFDAVNKG